MNIPKIDDIPVIVSDRELFDKTVYTSLTDALIEIKNRDSDLTLQKQVLRFTNNDLPEEFEKARLGVLVRNIVTPNYETRRFLSLIDGVNELQPLLAEYPEDKFFPGNPLKSSLCKLNFYKNRDRNGSLCLEKLAVVDTNMCAGNYLSNIKVNSDLSLQDFHHKFFMQSCSNFKVDSFYNISSWYKNHGGLADEYYKSLLALFLKHAVLFENFVLGEKHETNFINKIFLPAFIDIWNITGYKPLIVSLEPTSVENDKFWMCYPYEDKGVVEEILKTTLPSVDNDSIIIKS